MRAIIVAALIALPGPALAQVSCGMEMGRWVCRDMTPPAQPDIVGNAERARQKAFDDVAAARRQAQAPGGAYRAAVALAVQEGRCPEAIHIAERSGDPGLLRDVLAACR